MSAPILSQAATPARPARKRNGEFACGCRPYHLHGEEGFRLCAEGKRLYKAMTSTLGEPHTPAAQAANKAYADHVGLDEEDEGGAT